MIKDSRSNVVLDIITSDNLDILLSWRNNELIYKWCRQNDLIDFENHKSWFDSLASNKKIKMYLIRDALCLKPVGVCGITDIDLLNQRAEFSLYIDPLKHRLGYGENALWLLLYTCFNRYPLNVIYGETLDDNPALKIFKKLGFVFEGTRRDFYYKEGKHISAHLLSIKKSELKNIRAICDK